MSLGGFIKHSKYGAPTKVSNAMLLIHKLNTSILRILSNDESNVLTPSEIDTLMDISKKGKDRIKRGIIGSENVIIDERNQTINKIIK